MEDDLINELKNLNISFKSKKPKITLTSINLSINKNKDLIIYNPITNFQKKYNIPQPINIDNIIISNEYKIIIEMLSIKYNKELVEACFKYLIKTDNSNYKYLASFIHHFNCNKLINSGWQYNNIFKWENKLSPNLVSFDYLDEEEKRKLYDIAIEIINVNI